MIDLSVIDKRGKDWHWYKTNQLPLNNNDGIDLNNYNVNSMLLSSIRLETWGLTNPEILKYYVIKAFYVPEVIKTELKCKTISLVTH